MENCKDVINAFSKCDTTGNVLVCTFDEDTKTHKCTFNDKECIIDDSVDDENKDNISNLKNDLEKFNYSDLNKISDNKDSFEYGGFEITKK